MDADVRFPEVPRRFSSADPFDEIVLSVDEGFLDKAATREILAPS